jgi:hypothetical protein
VHTVARILDGAEIDDGLKWYASLRSRDQLRVTTSSSTPSNAKTFDSIDEYPSQQVTEAVDHSTHEHCPEEEWETRERQFIPSSCGLLMTLPNLGKETAVSTTQQTTTRGRQTYRTTGKKNRHPCATERA